MRAVSPSGESEGDVAEPIFANDSTVSRTLWAGAMEETRRRIARNRTVFMMAKYRTMGPMGPMRPIRD
jgi:hypothetical protein